MMSDDTPRLEYVAEEVYPPLKPAEPEQAPMGVPANCTCPRAPALWLGHNEDCPVVKPIVQEVHEPVRRKKKESSGERLRLDIEKALFRNLGTLSEEAWVGAKVDARLQWRAFLKGGKFWCLHEWAHIKIETDRTFGTAAIDEMVANLALLISQQPGAPREMRAIPPLVIKATVLFKHGSKAVSIDCIGEMRGYHWLRSSNLNHCLKCGKRAISESYI